MDSWERAALPAALLLMVVSGLMISPVEAAGRQSIVELDTPTNANIGAAFTVKTKAQYDFAGQGDVVVWARVRRCSCGPLGTGDVAHAAENAKTVSGKGELAWSFQIEAEAVGGNVTLEAYVLHWENNQEIMDDARRFIVLVLSAAPNTASVTSTSRIELSTIKTSSGGQTSSTYSIRTSGISWQDYLLVAAIIVLATSIIAVVIIRSRWITSLKRPSSNAQTPHTIEFLCRHLTRFG